MTQRDAEPTRPPASGEHGPMLHATDDLNDGAPASGELSTERCPIAVTETGQCVLTKGHGRDSAQRDCVPPWAEARATPPALDDRDALVEAVALALSDESWQDPRVDIPLPDLLGDSILYHFACLHEGDSDPAESREA